MEKFDNKIFEANDSKNDYKKQKAIIKQTTSKLSRKTTIVSNKNSLKI
jgi:hypothetical protein